MTVVVVQPPANSPVIVQPPANHPVVVNPTVFIGGGGKPRVVTLVDQGSSTYRINVDTTDVGEILTPTGNLTMLAPSGTPAEMQPVMLKVHMGATGYAMSWNSKFVSSTVATLPTATLAPNSTSTFGFRYDSLSTKWVLLAADDGATGGGTVKSVNGIMPDGAGNIALEASDVDGLMLDGSNAMEGDLNLNGNNIFGIQQAFENGMPAEYAQFLAGVAERMKFKDAWDPAATYNQNDVAIFNGKVYLATEDISPGVQPDIGPVQLVGGSQVGVAAETPQISNQLAWQFSVNADTVLAGVRITINQNGTFYFGSGYTVGIADQFHDIDSANDIPFEVVFPLDFARLYQPGQVVDISFKNFLSDLIGYPTLTADTIYSYVDIGGLTDLGANKDLSGVMTFEDDNTWFGTAFADPGLPLDLYPKFALLVSTGDNPWTQIGSTTAVSYPDMYSFVLGQTGDFQNEINDLSTEIDTKQDTIVFSAMGSINGFVCAHWDASSISGLTDGQAVTTWPDSSGYGWDLGQATSGKRPIYKATAFNGLPCVRFDGVDDFMARTTFGFNAGPFTKFSYAIVMYRHNGNTNDGYVFDLRGNSSFVDLDISVGGRSTTARIGTAGIVDTFTYDTSGMYIITAVNDGATLTAYRNQSRMSYAAGGSSINPTQFGVGCNDSGGTPQGFFIGDIAEIVMWTDALTEAEVSQVYRTLAHKYGMLGVN